MLTILKKLAAKILANEIEALKVRYTNAAFALDRIEQDVVHIAKDSAPELQSLANTTLQRVLASADKVRTGVEVKIHTWEQDAYAALSSSRVLDMAKELLAKTEIFGKL